MTATITTTNAMIHTADTTTNGGCDYSHTHFHDSLARPNEEFRRCEHPATALFANDHDTKKGERFRV